MGGYDDLQLAENVFQIRFKGNAYTSKEKAADYTLLRSAELAKENGFGYFIITERDSWNKIYKHQEPDKSETSGSVRVMNKNSATYKETTVTERGSSLTFLKPRTENTIVCFKERPDSLGSFYDVNFIIPQLKSKYGITSQE